MKSVFAGIEAICDFRLEAPAAQISPSVTAQSRNAFHSAAVSQACDLDAWATAESLHPVLEQKCAHAGPGGHREQGDAYRSEHGKTRSLFLIVLPFVFSSIPQKPQRHRPYAPRCVLERQEAPSTTSEVCHLTILLRKLHRNHHKRGEPHRLNGRRASTTMRRQH